MMSPLPRCARPHRSEPCAPAVAGAVPVPASRRAGFTLVELVVALAVLTIGMMGMAAAAGYATTEVRSSAMRTQRTAAIESVLEELRGRAFNGTAFDSAVATLPYASAKTIGSVKVWYDVVADTTFGKKVTFYTKAPQYKAHVGWTTTAVDTFVVELYRPIK